MSQVHLYFISIVISILAGIGISIAIRKPLYALLVDVCGTQERARFWLHITILSYLLVAAAIGLSFQPETSYAQGLTEFRDGAVYEERVYYESPNYDPILYNLGGQLGRTLFGLLLITGIMAFFISRFIRRQDQADIRERAVVQPGQG